MNFRFDSCVLTVRWYLPLLLGMVYAFLNFTALELTIPPNALPIMGYANALAITTLLVQPRCHWPLLVLSCAVFHVLAHVLFSFTNSPADLRFIPGNLLFIVISALLFQRFCGTPQQVMTRVGALIKTLIIISVLAPIAPSLLSALLISHLFQSFSFIDIWLFIYDGLFSGSAILMPFGLMLLSQGWKPLFSALKAPSVLITTTVAIIGALVFPDLLNYPYAYIGITLFAVALSGQLAALAPAIMACAVIAALLLLTDDTVTPHPSAYNIILEHHLPLVLTLLPPILFGIALTHLKHYAQALERKKTQFRDLYRRTPIMMQSVDDRLRLISISDNFSERMGVSRDELIGRQLSEFMTAESNARLFSEVLTTLKRQSYIENAALKMIDGRGKTIDVLFSAVYEIDEDDRVLILTVLKDISEQRRLARELATEKELMEITLQSIGDGVATTNAGGTIRYMNPIAERLLGVRINEIIGRPFDEVFHLFDEQTGESINPVAQCLASGMGQTPSTHARLTNFKNDRDYGIRFVVSPLRAREGELLGTVMVFQDFTESRELTQRMTYLAHHDTLTALPNRTLFQEQLESICQQADAKFGVVFVDLDHFKNVNDSLGHAIGDGLLRAVAERLNSAIRNRDTVFRLGGDEFVLLLSNTSEYSQISRITQRIIDILSTPFNIDGHELQVTASLGIARFPADGKSPETLMKHADTAMYRAKRDGRNRFNFFSPGDDRAALRRLSLENDLRHDLGRGLFELHYQPIINAITHQVRSLEVLVRWRRSGYDDLVYPDDFIGIAEESGLIVPLGDEILKESLQQLVRWRNEGLENVHIAVNVSARQLAENNFVDRLQTLLNASGLPNHCLEIEITESTLIHDPEQMLQTLNRLRQLSIQVSIDDFGTGYSSLSYLKRFPVNCVKIDRSFIHEMENDRSARKLVQAILAMAESLSLDSVAEGVENSAQAELLRDLGCPALQGYHFSRPIRAEDVATTIAVINHDHAHAQHREFNTGDRE